MEDAMLKFVNTYIHQDKNQKPFTTKSLTDAILFTTILQPIDGF